MNKQNYRQYTAERLEKINSRYLSVPTHKIRQSDVDTANKCIAIMYNRLGEQTPRVGDLVHYTRSDGNYYGYAHIDEIEGTNAIICLEPFTPFVDLNQDKINISHVSGGPFVSVPLNKLIADGNGTKLFQFFGSSGAYANGAVQFEGYANYWEYTGDNYRFGEYSTKNYDKITFRRVNGVMRPVSATGNASILENEFLYKKWLDEMKAVTFGDFKTDDKVIVFTYKEVSKLVTKKFWDMLELPTSIRRMNASDIPVKLDVNDRTKTVTVYRYTNCSDVTIL